MKNLFISILLIASFSASIFAADEVKSAVFTPKTQLELAVLFGAFSVAGEAAWGAAWDAAGDNAADDVRDAAGDSAIDAAGRPVFTAARAAAWGPAWFDAGNNTWSAAWSVAGAVASEAASEAVAEVAVDRARIAARASFIAVIDELSEIKKNIQQKLQANLDAKLKDLTPPELAELYSKVIDIFMKSFDDEKYDQTLSIIKTFYVVSLARIFPNAGFEVRDEFIAYKNKISSERDCDPYDPEALCAYVWRERKKSVNEK